MEPILELTGVGYSYHSLSGETKALHDINFSIQPGEFIAIVGPSGCGKSTLLSLICGLLKAEEGIIQINASPIGYMLQKDHLLEWRSVWRNATLGLELHHQLNSAHEENVQKMLETYGLADFRDATPSSLSGGMRQRVALIRTLALQPELLLLDEPFSDLDYQTRLEVADDIGTIIQKEGKTALLVTHDLSEAISLGDRVIVLSKRPATVVSILDMEFKDEKNGRLSPLARRNTKEFPEYFNQIWKEIKKNG